MKKHKKLIIIATIIVILIMSCIIFFVMKNKKIRPMQNMPNDMQKNMQENIGERKNKSEEKETTLKAQAEIKSALTEKIEMHATYYLEEVYREKNDYVASGEKLLKYTNGTYFNAPYDCYVTGFNLPEESGKILNSHYVEVSSIKELKVTMNIDETNIEKITVGKEVAIEVTALNKTYTGYVTSISSVASNGKFQIEIEFENDGDIKLGMSSTVSIKISE